MRRGELAVLIVRIPKNLLLMGEVVVMDIVFFFLEGLILMVEKGLFGLALIEKRKYWPKRVTAEEII